MTLVEGRNYRQWQKRNTEHFMCLSKSQQTEIYKQGYCNVGWSKVKKSWEILNSQNLPQKEEKEASKFTSNVVNLFEHKLRKGNPVGAIGLSILDAERVWMIVKTTIEDMEKPQWLIL